MSSRDRSYRLERGETAPGGVRRIGLGRAEEARWELIDAKGAADLAESIHAARKDLKKLRALLRLVRDELGEELFRAENRRYRDVGRRLASSRDAEVKLETLDSLRRHCGSDLPDDACEAWRDALVLERDEIAGGAQGELGSRIEEALFEVQSGSERISSWPLEVDSWQLVEPGLRRSYRLGRRGMRRTRSDASAENVHEWRKRAKDLWYQLRIVRNAWPALIGEMADQAHELADLLGDHHDLVILGADLKARDRVGARAEIESLISRRQEELLRVAFEIGARFYAEKPKAFCARLEVYWLAWRHPGGCAEPER